MQLKTSKKITVGMVDDDRLFLKSLCMLINGLPPFEVVTTANNGQALLDNLKGLEELPDILLLDVNMKGKNGIETAREIREQHPLARMVALSMNDSDQVIIQMIRSGCCAYLLKDMDPEDLPVALQDVYEKGYYNGDVYNQRGRHLLRQALEQPIAVNAKEKEFLQLSSTDMTYKQIAAQMHLSERTIDGYREALFEKLNVQSRVGMVMEGIRRQLITF